ncbi:MAG: hypothetical protein ACM3S2_12285 [Ignavibacteriales bacterium]
MKRILLILIISAAALGSAYAQGRMHRRMDKAQERIEELEKVKLVETLELSDDAMTKFFNRRKDFKERMRALTEQKEEKLNQLQDMLNNEDNSDKNEQNFRKYVDEIVQIDATIGKSRSEFYNSLRDIMNYKQISKLMVFERNFRREIIDIIAKERKRKFE